MECFVVYSDDIEGRFDCHFYKPEYVELDKKIKSITKNKLEDYIISISGGSTPDIKKSETYYTNENKGIPFLRVQNVTPEGIKLEDVKFINKETHNGLLKRSQVKESNLLTKITGVGRMAVSSVAPKNFIGNINQHLVVIETENEETSQVLSTFLNSDIGEMLAKKRSTGGTRPALDYTALKSIPIVFRTEIIKIMVDGIKKKKLKESESHKLLDSINNYVLEELKLNLSEIKEEKIYCLDSSELKNNRNDPYYFNPKFKRLLADLQKSKIALTELKEVVDTIVSGKTPSKKDYADEGNLILKVNCLKKNKIVWNKLSHFKDGVSGVKSIKDKDILLLSSAHQSEYLGKNPSIVEIPQKFKDKQIFFVGELLCIRPNTAKINPYYLLAILKLPVYYLFVNREKRGQTSHLYSEDLGKVKIPLPSFEVQNKIAEELKNRMQRAEKLQNDAKEELETSKREVESIILRA